MSRFRLKWGLPVCLAVATGLVVALSWAPVGQLDAFPVILVNVAVASAVVVHFRLGRTDGLTPLLAIGVSLVIAISIVFLVSDEPLGALEALLLGPLTRSTRWSTWITDSITLALLGFASVIVFRARQISLGADGQFTGWSSSRRRHLAVFCSAGLRECSSLASARTRSCRH